MRQFINSIIPVHSRVDERPDKEVVFVPEAGLRWGAPADLNFRFNQNEGGVESENDPPSVNVVDTNEYRIRRGSEVVNDTTTPDGQFIPGKQYICYCGRETRTREERESLPGGAQKITTVVEIVDLYVDASRWAQSNNRLVAGNFSSVGLGSPIC